MPQVTVLIPNYKHATFLNQRIDSVLNQTFQDFEVIILDDCSPDDSKSVIEQYRNHPRVSHIVYNETNSGSTFKQWKIGLELAKAPIVWIAESDDWADTSFLERLYDVIAKDDNVTVCYSRTYRTNELGEIRNIESFGEYKDSGKWTSDFVIAGDIFIQKYLLNRNIIPNASAVLFKKDRALQVIENVSGYRYAGDWLFWAYMASGAKVGYVAAPLNYFRRYSNATSLSVNPAIVDKQVREFLSVIAIIKNKILKTSAIKLDHNWIVDFWISNHRLFSVRGFMNPPFNLELKFTFYKKWLYEYLFKVRIINKAKYYLVRSIDKVRQSV